MKITSTFLLLWLLASAGLAQSPPTFLGSSVYPVASPFCGSFNEEESAEFILPTSDGGYLLVGSFACGATDWDGRVVKINASGTILWQDWPGGGGFDYLRSAVEVSDGYVVVGEYDNAGVAAFWARKYSFNGSLLWGNYYVNPNQGWYQSAYTVTTTYAGNIIIGGAFGGFPVTLPVPTPPSQAGRVWVLDQGGTPITGGVVDAGGYIVWKIEKAADNASYYIFGEQFDNTEYDCFDDPSLITENNLLTAYSSYYSDIRVDKLNSQLGTIWINTYGGVTPDGFIDGIATPDGGFALIGKTQCINSFGGTNGPNNIANDPNFPWWLLKGASQGAITGVRKVGGNFDIPIIIDDEYRLEPFGLANGCGGKYLVGLNFSGQAGFLVSVQKLDMATDYWTAQQDFPSDFTIGTDVKVAPNGNMVVAANTLNNAVFNNDFSKLEWMPDPSCCPTPPNIFNCGNITYHHTSPSNPLQYTFTSIGQNIAPGYTWKVNNQPITGATTNPFTYTFNSAGSYDVCFPTIGANGCVEYCCRKYCIAPPINCEASVLYAFNNGQMVFNLQTGGQTSAASWAWDDNPSVEIGAGNQIAVPIPSQCTTRTISVKYIDATGCWRICCRTVYVCNPFACYNFTYSYNGSNGFVFKMDPSLSTATNITWTVDDHPSGALNIGNDATSQPYPVPLPCQKRTITLRYYLNGVWYICCRTILLCSPFDCGSVTLNYTANQGYTFALASATSYQNISWQVDSPNIIPLGNQGTSQPLPVPAPGSCQFRTVSVRYFDPSPAWNCWRICCLTFWYCNPNDCSTAIAHAYGQNGNTTLQINANYQQIQWYDGTTAIGNTNPLITTFPPGTSPTICVKYYDIGSGCFYYCCKTLSVPFPCQLTADFNYTIAGTTVTFTNTSVGSPAFTSSAWTFTNGNTTLTSTLANPVQTLPPGTWNCCLIVSNGGCSSLQKCQSVSIPTANAVQFDIGDNICGAPGQVVEVPIRVSNFTNVLNFQISIKLNNTAVGQVVELIPVGLPGSAVSSDDNISVGSMLWSDGSPLTLPDNTIIGNIRIQINGSSGQTSAISFTDTPTPIYAEVLINGSSAGVIPVMSGGSTCVSSSVQLCGKIRREDDAPIPNVTVTLTGGASVQTTITDAQGNYCFQNVVAGGNYVISPKRDINYTNNVNVGDLSKIQRHILNLEPLSSPYKRIAANAKPSNTGINVGDLSEIQRLILGIINDFPEVDSWRFVPKSFVFPNPQNPFGSAFPESIAMNNVGGNASDIDFTGIKMGDVTLTNPPGLQSSTDVSVSDGNNMALSFYMANATVQTGDIVDIPVKTNGFQNITGAQFSIGWDASKLAYQSITSLNPTLGIQTSDFNQTLTAQGKLGFSWFNGAGSSLPDGSTVFTLRFMALGNLGNTPVVFSDDPTPPYYVDLNDELQATTTNSQVTVTPNCGVSGPSSVIVTDNGSGTATATAQGGTSPYEYQWSNGQTSQTATGLTGGTYTITVTDVNGCSVTGSITIDTDMPCPNWDNPTPGTGWVDFNNDFGGAPCDDGTGCPFNEITDFSVWASEAYEVEGFIQGGTYAFSMCNGVGAGSWVPNFTIIAPSGIVDAYGLGDGDGCTITWTATESGTYLIVINEAGHCGGGNNLSTDNGWPALTCISNANCLLPCASSTLSITSLIDNGNSTATVITNGGVPPYTYNWSNGQTSQTAVDLPTGNYTVTVTDTNGCTAQGNLDLISSDNEAENQLNLQLFPNPTTGKCRLSLELSEATLVEVSVFDVTGKQVWKDEKQGNNTFFTFDFTQHPSGVYLLRAMVGGEILTKRLIISR